MEESQLSSENENVLKDKQDYFLRHLQEEPEGIQTSDSADDVPEYIRQLAEGKKETIDFDVSLNSRPLWLDEDRFKRGQKFASDHIFGITYSEILSLFMLFAMKSILGVLIFTGKSSTPYTAFRRYFGTVQKVISWYEEDVWHGSNARTNMGIVRGLHKGVYSKFQNASEEVLMEKITLGDPERVALWFTTKDVLKNDFMESCSSHPSFTYLSRRPSRVIWISQLDMAITQFGFVGLAVTYPKYFGIYVSDSDLEDFIHMWRGLGYLLGIKDQYNFCDGDLRTVRRRSMEIIDGVVKPAFRNIDSDWEHMSRCLSGGIGLYSSTQIFETSVMYLCHTLGVCVPRFRKQLTYRTRLRFYFRRFLFFLARIPFIRRYYNIRFSQGLKDLEKTSAEVFAEWEATEFEYMQQPGKVSVGSQESTY